jgi:hypothetical protein
MRLCARRRDGDGPERIDMPEPTPSPGVGHLSVAGSGFQLMRHIPVLGQVLNCSRPPTTVLGLSLNAGGVHCLTVVTFGKARGTEQGSRF